ncbi:DUF7109 family protein [Halobellus captivus]|uniref:DUF7109 family protein n=1 Tax=Halobellus captivus TaxID=2592614 RepID=UPI0011A4A681|nr:hypothetical protein [Halobellus captivus]
MTTELQTDELAGVVDLFGALTPAELRQALDELAFKQGGAVDEPVASDAVEDAVDAYAIVRYERDGQSFLVPGPAAFPTLPANAEDLPHILEIPERDVDRDAASDAVEARLTAEAARAVDAGDEAAMRDVLDVTYDVAVWSDRVAVDDLRDRLADALDE